MQLTTNQRNDIYETLETSLQGAKLTWAKKFPDEFYIELFRLQNWSYEPFSIKRPSQLGKVIDRIIFDKLPEHVLKELQIRKFSHADLTHHLQQVLLLMRVSSNWRKFERNFARAFQE